MSERASSMSVDLTRRAAPQQKRSQERIRVILEATKRLLMRDDSESITTSTIAREADVPVSSVYRYFPNVYAIYLAILDEFKTETDRIVSGIFQDDVQERWQDGLGRMILGLRQLVAENPSYGAVFRLTLMTPELSAVRQDWNLRIAKVCADRWRQGFEGFSGGDPDQVARMTVEIYCAAEILIFEARNDPAAADAYFGEALKAMERYLEPYLSN